MTTVVNFRLLLLLPAALNCATFSLCGCAYCVLTFACQAKILHSLSCNRDVSYNTVETDRCV